MTWHSLANSTQPGLPTRRRARNRAWTTALLTCCSIANHVRADPGPYAVLERFADVLVYIEEAYVDPVERTRLIEGATAGMVAELDPHSSYLTPVQFAQFIEDTQGAFAGLGVEVDFREDRVTVIATMPESPAERAGILPGDRIVAVDSVPITGVRAEAIIRRMRGPTGTKVRLTLRREGTAEPLQVTLTRAIVNVPSVEAKLLDHGIGYLRLKSFQEGSYVELIENVARISATKQLSGLLLDLRGNPGGLVSEAVAIADELLDRGTIYSARHRGQVVETVASNSGDLLEHVPLVVLVGAATASSAEIVTGALQDRGRALVVGEPTFGKGSVQNVIELPGGAGLLLTTLRYFTPNGRAIQARGLVPDVIVKSVDSRQALREADLAGHLQTEGAPAEVPATVAKQPAAPRGSTAHAAPPTDSERTTPTATDLDEGLPPATPSERVPLASIPGHPTASADPVLAKGFELLLGKLTKR